MWRQGPQAACVQVARPEVPFPPRTQGALWTHRCVALQLSPVPRAWLTPSASEEVHQGEQSGYRSDWPATSRSWSGLAGQEVTSQYPEGWVAVSLVAGAFRGRGLSRCWWWSETQRGGSWGAPVGRGVTSGHVAHLPGAVQPLSVLHPVLCPWPVGGVLP